MDTVAVATACANECKRQKADEISDLIHMLRAYERLWMFGGQMFESGAGFATFARDINPGDRIYGYRITPVTFQNGGSSCHPSLIPDKMNDLINAIVETVEAEGFFLSPPSEREHAARMITKEFLWIHPFTDGNGRIGFLLYNYLLGTVEKPLALPDFQW